MKLTVKITTEGIGFRNKINAIPLINLIKTYKPFVNIIADDILYEQLGICKFSRSRLFDIQFLPFGHNWKSTIKNTLFTLGKSYGFPYRIKRKFCAFPLTNFQSIYKQESEVTNVFRLGQFIDLPVFTAKPYFGIKRDPNDIVPGRVIIGTTNVPGKLYPNWSQVLVTLKQIGFDPVYIGPRGSYNPNNIPRLISIMKTAQAYIGPDCGITHFADALNIPICMLFGGTLIAKNRPLNYHRIVTRNNADLSCVPCYDWFGKIKCANHYKCMNIKPLDVVRSFCDMLIQGIEYGDVTLFSGQVELLERINDYGYYNRE